MTSKIDREYSFERPYQIHANTDLNNLKTPGVYVCPVGAWVTTLQNCPIGIAFSMEVFSRGTTVTQVIIGLDVWYFRIEDSSQASGWRPWRSIAST